MSAPGDRYTGRPFLRLLELLVVSMTGQLGDADRARLEALTPKLGETFGRDGTWQEIVAAEGGLSQQDLDDLAAMWQRNLERAAAAGDVLDPQEWARHVVDANYPV